MDKKEKKVQYCFGLNEDELGPDNFDTIDDLLEFAYEAYGDPDGNYWDEDMEDYSDVIWIGIASDVVPHDYAVDLVWIHDRMEDNLAMDFPTYDDPYGIRYTNEEEAKKAWLEFVDKYFVMPFDRSADWIGNYSLKEHKWLERFGEKED